MFSDSHMHSRFSTDSDALPEEMLEAAIAQGLPSVCFTDHFDMDFPYVGFQLDTERYLREMEALRSRYADRIRVRVGVELGMQPHLGERIRDYAAAHPFDYVIGSMHLVDGRDPYCRDEIPADDRTMYAHYFEQTLECLQKTEGIHALGHLDYVVRYGYEKEKCYRPADHMEVIDAILRMLIDRGIMLEVNTAGLKKDLGFPNPHPEIVRRYAALGGEAVTLGADAHRPVHVAYRFGEMRDFLLGCGIRYVAEFTGKKPEFVSVEREMS